MSPEQLRKQLRALTRKTKTITVKPYGELTLTELSGRQRLDVIMTMTGDDGQADQSKMPQAMALALAKVFNDVPLVATSVKSKLLCVFAIPRPTKLARKPSRFVGVSSSNS